MTGKLYLADGSLYQGHGFGAKKTAVGELVFNTSMTGYQEILTDPSYWGAGDYDDVSSDRKLWDPSGI